MIYRLLLAALCAVCFSVESEARQRTYAAHPDCNVLWPCQDVGPSPRGERVVLAMGGFGTARKVYTPRAAVEKRTLQQNPIFQSKPQQAAANLKEKLTGSRRSVVRDSLTAGEPRQRMTGITPAIVSHPPGCPSRAFCGCGAAVRVFGSPIRSLWLAANWFKFPRTTPAPGAVAVRRHHVFVLEADLGGGVWQVYDANSGGRRTRIHARSIAGYVIVNPHGAA